MANPSNPNGANQYQLDPRQKLCWENYINPKSETFGNGTQSALKAGYEYVYADQITTVEWFKGKVRRLNMLSKAEKVLDEMLELDTQTVKQDEDGEQIIKIDPALVKIKQDTAKFIAERVGKSEGYSTRTEHTGAEGKDLTIKFDNSFNEPTSEATADSTL